MRILALLLLVGVMAAGCRTTRAAMPIERPPLEVPPAPPRVVVPAPAPELSQPEPVPSLPPPPANPAPARPRPAPSSGASKEAASNPEVKPEDTTATPAAPAAPVPTLRTPATADTAAAERLIREALNRAQTVLNGVDYRRQSPERQKAYDQAKDFITGAEAQIKVSNFELAKEFAEKAEKLARELQGR